MTTFFRLLILLNYFIIGFAVRNSGAQSTGAWNTVSAKAGLGGNWSTFGEFQLRSLSFYNRFYYYELKGGATYSFDDRYSVTMGTGLYNTFREGVNFGGYTKRKELRIWEQFVVEQNLSVLDFEHRLRVEQRFMGKYANRFRYRFHVTVPLNNKKIEAGTLYGAVYDEIFGMEVSPVLVRNRFYAGAGYRFNDLVALQLGWLSQVDYSYPGKDALHFFAVSLSFNLGNPSAFGRG